MVWSLQKPFFGGGSSAFSASSLVLSAWTMVQFNDQYLMKIYIFFVILGNEQSLAVVSLLTMHKYIHIHESRRVHCSHRYHSLPNE